MTEYVSPFQQQGHDGPCHDMKADPEQPADVKPIPIRIVAYEGEGLTLGAGELQPTAENAGDIGTVKRALAVLLRELAAELDEQADAHALEAQLDDGDRPEGNS